MRKQFASSTARHLLIEYLDCDVGVLNDLAVVREAMLEAATVVHAHVVGSMFRRFEPQGVTGVVVIAESHLSIHTWPEFGYAAVDLFTCGDGDPGRAHAVLGSRLRASRSVALLVRRGAREDRLEAVGCPMDRALDSLPTRASDLGERGPIRGGA